LTDPPPFLDFSSVSLSVTGLLSLTLAFSIVFLSLLLTKVGCFTSSSYTSYLVSALSANGATPTTCLIWSSSFAILFLRSSCTFSYGIPSAAILSANTPPSPSIFAKSSI